jgi:hypothetical protein
MIATEWYQFENGKVYEVDGNGYITGIAKVSLSLDDGFDAFFDDLSDDLIGSTMLEDIGYTCIGGGRFLITGCVTDALESARLIAFGSADWHMAFATQHGLQECEIEHATASGRNEYTAERVYLLPSGRELRTERDPDGINHVRICIPGITPIEIAYWNADELGEAPAEVLGAIIGAALGAGKPA